MEKQEREPIMFFNSPDTHSHFACPADTADTVTVVLGRALLVCPRITAHRAHLSVGSVLQ